jgi:predicted TPR repeat methyltransferase
MNLPDIKSDQFNRAYYEDGIKNKISGYENYHWIPTRSFSEAIEIIDRFEFNSCVDYGCAKGFLVHALRQLGKDAYGEDISDYAIENADKIELQNMFESILKNLSGKYIKIKELTEEEVFLELL